MNSSAPELAITLCQLALGGQTVKNLLRLSYEFELDRSQPNWVAKRNASPCVDLRRLASPFGQGFKII